MCDVTLDSRVSTCTQKLFPYFRNNLNSFWKFWRPLLKYIVCVMEQILTITEMHSHETVYGRRVQSLRCVVCAFCTSRINLLVLLPH